MAAAQTILTGPAAGQDLNAGKTVILSAHAGRFGRGARVEARPHRWAAPVSALILTLGLTASSLAATPEAPAPSSPRENFNAGARNLRAGKLREAEGYLESALASQNERVQPSALYDLGHVRFGLGIEELKKGPSASATASRGRSAEQVGAEANRLADEALAGEDVQKIVAAYFNGRGARKELKAATAAVRRAIKAHGAALSRWQRASGDFKSALELRRADADARTNAAIVDRCIARLVDSLHELEQCSNSLGQQSRDLAEKMKQLKGRMPGDQPPPGGGEEEEDEDFPFGPRPGEKEGPSKDGEETQMSPEQAGWMLSGFKLDNERRLPMGEGQQAEPRERDRPTW